ncbi:MAG: histidine phosphatase family protein, partial [Actinomycetota bacterium]|nr:histidine phosphatase family protein [Actinomycetota bacterium]
MRLLLVRHGQSTWNADGRWQGWADPPLSELGEQQAVEATTRLSELGITALASSDLIRARRTAEILAERLGVELVSVDPALREYDVGEWCGLTRPEIEDRWPGLLAEWDAGQLGATPGGETRQAFVARAMTALTRLAGLPDLGDRPVVVTHGGLVRAVQRHLGAGTDRIPNLGGRW